MTQEASSAYLRDAVMTASPEQLQLMLYDGAIRFTNQARDLMIAGDLDASCEKLIRAQHIVIEMRNGLRFEVNPSLCGRLASLYDFIYGRLVEANMKRNPELIEDALRILHHQRETWQLLIEKLRGETKSPPAPKQPETPPEEIGATLSVEG